MKTSEMIAMMDTLGKGTCPECGSEYILEYEPTLENGFANVETAIDCENAECGWGIVLEADCVNWREVGKASES